MLVGRDIFLYERVQPTVEGSILQNDFTRLPNLPCQEQSLVSFCKSPKNIFNPYQKISLRRNNFLGNRE
ncbi:MAG: hypothetical protein D3924_00595 [Candidatus Electrothrix sp. AR4]|nr:hypothetical protein [Candidatus Electrothrix sp. AR4]